MKAKTLELVMSAKSAKIAMAVSPANVKKDTSALVASAGKETSVLLGFTIATSMLVAW